MTRAYVPCPFWDEWVVISDIATGHAHSLRWFWSQQNEHRILVPRLLILADTTLFHGRNVSLFVEIFLVQLVDLAILVRAVELQGELPAFLRRTMEGLFAFALFHPNQIENFTWAYQVGFVLPFALSTFALTAVTYFHRWQRPAGLAGSAPFASLFAAMNLAGGLLIGPVLILCAWIKRLPTRYLLWTIGVTAISTAVYLWGYRRIGSDLALIEVPNHTRELFVYVLTYLGASWTAMLPHKERLMAFLGLGSLLFIAVHHGRRRPPSNLELLLLAQCSLVVLFATVTAVGRIQFGAGQAFASRYQTPAMIFWAWLGCLLLLMTYTSRPDKISYAQAAVIAIMLASVATFPRMWQRTTAHADSLRAACNAVMGGSYNERAARTLYEYPAIVKEARPFLRHLWGR